MRTRAFGVVVWAAFFASGHAAAATYYVSESGLDSNAGTQAAPWKSIDAVNAAKLQSGDQIAFEAGGRFYGTITAVSGVTYGAYGTGDKPVITALTTVPAASFHATGANIWEASVPNGGAVVTSLLVGGVRQPVSRYPRADAENGGYLTFASHASATSIDDSQLQALIGTDLPAGTSFVGGNVVLRLRHWVHNTTQITAEDAKALTFAAYKDHASYPLQDGFGYFIENHPAATTQPGDWYYTAATHTVGVYFAGAASDVAVPTLDHNVTMGQVKNVTIQGLAFEGANAEAIFGNLGVKTLSIQGCDITFAGMAAISLYGSDISVDGNNVSSSVELGISVQSPDDMANVTVSNNVVTDTLGNTGVSVVVKSGATVEGNVITNSGYNGINYGGSSITVKNNVIDTFCTTLDDGGGIYTYDGPNDVLADQHLIGNIVTHAIGVGAGTPGGGSIANGIYLDIDSNHVEIAGNTVAHIKDAALYGNSPSSITANGNAFFDARLLWNFVRVISTPSSTAGDVTDLDFEDNVFVATDPTQTLFKWEDHGVNVPAASTAQARIAAMGTVKNNAFYAQNLTPWAYDYQLDAASPYVNPPNDSLAEWQTFSTLEAGSKMEPAGPAYTTQNMGSNLYPAGDFEDAGVQSSKNAMTPYAPKSNVGTYTLAYNGASKVDGAGSLELDFAGTPADEDVLFLTSSIGTITADHSYLVRFTTVGSSENGRVRAAIRKSTTPYNDLASAQLVPFGTAKATHEVLVSFKTPASVDASVELQVFESSGDTWVDDVQVFQVDATATNPDDYVRLETNATNAPTTVALDKTYVDVGGTPYCGSVDLAAYSSIVLFTSEVPCTPATGAAGSGQGGSTGQAGGPASGGNVGTGGSSNVGGGSSTNGGSGGAGVTAGHAGNATAGHGGAVSGGAPSSGGKSSSGGATSAGGPATGGTSASAGGPVGGSGGASNVGDAASSDSGGGCAVVENDRDGVALWGAALALGLVARRAGRRRRNA